MGYILIFIASACYAGEFALVKFYQKEMEQKMLTVFFMLLVRYAVGACIALCCSGFSLDFSNISPFATILMASVFILYNVLGVAILSRGNLAVYSVFMMVGGMLLPMLDGIANGQDISIPQIIGAILMIGFILLQTLQFEKKSSDEQEKKRDVKKLVIFTLLCILAFIDNGSLGIIRTHEVSKGAHEYTFAFSYCLLTSLIGGVGVLYYLTKNKSQTKETLKPCLKPLALLVLIGIGAVTNIGDILLLVATSLVSEVIMYPVVSGATIVFSALAALLIYNEKTSKRETIAIIGSALATLLFIF